MASTEAGADPPRVRSAAEPPPERRITAREATLLGDYTLHND